MNQAITIPEETLEKTAAWCNLLRQEIGKVIVGQQYLIDRLIVGLLANGHVLLEGVPGLAKTLSIRTLAQAVSAHFQRIQFTPDLLPSDIVGTLIYEPSSGTFQTKQGPIFTNLLLADEINRAPAKVQSALLEAMQERQVTLGDQTHKLPSPFLVLATENPIDQEGTYPLPEAQVDRFMLKLCIGYPSREEEKQILETMATTQQQAEVSPIVSTDDIVAARQLVDAVYIDERIRHYIVELVFASRKPSDYGLDLDAYVHFGGSPRATIALALASRAWALLHGRGYVTPQDVKDIGMDVLRHRLILTYEAEAEDLSSEDLIKKLFETVPVP